MMGKCTQHHMMLTGAKDLLPEIIMINCGHCLDQIVLNKVILTLVPIADNTDTRCS